MTPSILLVDDNPVQVATRKAVLERSGRAVLVASSGEQALGLLSDPETFPSIALIITDHVMPGMDGPQLVRELRRFCLSLPVLVLSGLPGAEAEYEGLNALFRLKPFAPEELIRLTEELLRPPMSRTA